MESDWHPHGRLPTLPSVAELLASSSRPASDSTAACHFQTANPQRPVSRSTPPNGPAVQSAPTIAPASSEQTYRVVANHASHANPTEAATPTSSSELHHHQPSTTRPASISFAPLPTSEACQSLQEIEIPINTRRQDSAIAQQPIDTANEGLSLECNSLHSHRSPNDGYQSVSPGSTSYPTSRSPAPTASSHVVTSSSRPHEHVVRPSAPLQPQTGSDSSQRRINSSLLPDLPSTNTTRQQRYNVRFAANHTPSNMPTTQRSRPSPPLLIAPTTRVAMDSPSPPQSENLAHTIEPAIQAITRSLQPSEEPLQSEGRGRDPSAERCPWCSETWNRPLPNPGQWGQDSPAENANGFARANMNLISQIQQHGKEADQKYEQWKEKHSHCPRNGYRERATSSEHMGHANSMHSKALDGQPDVSEHAQYSSNKRKSEHSHDDPAKLRKVTFDAITSTAPPVHPSSPT